MIPLLIMVLMASVSIQRACAACTFPSDLIGDWMTLSYGTLTFTTSSFSGFSSAITVGTLSFSCEISSGTQYVAKTSVVIYAGVSTNKYLCMNLERLSTTKYKMTLDGNKESVTNIRIYTSASNTVTVAEACSRTDSRSPGEFELLILASSLTSAFEACPSDFLFNYNVTMETTSVSNCENTLDGTISSSLLFNYSTCATSIAFNSGGHLNCLYHVTDGDSYLITYNNDTTTDETTKYRFTCFAFSKSAGILNATEYPVTCQTTQSPLSVPSPGITYIMYQTGYVPPSDPDPETVETDNTVLIAVLVTVSIIIIVGTIIIVVICYFKVCKEKPRPPTPPPPPKKKKPKPKLAVVNEYLPQKSSPRSQTDKNVELVNQLTKNRKDMRIDNLKEPAKPKWQKTWETEMRPPTPSTTGGSLLGSKKYPSACGLSTITNFSSFENIPKALADDRAVIERLASKMALVDIEGEGEKPKPQADQEKTEKDTGKEKQEGKETKDEKSSEITTEKSTDKSTEKPINETIITPRPSKSPRTKPKVDKQKEKTKEKVDDDDDAKSVLTISTHTQTEIKHEDFSPRPDLTPRGDTSMKNFTPRALPTVPEDDQMTEGRTLIPLDNRSLITDTGTFTTAYSVRSTLTPRAVQLRGIMEDSTTLGNYSLAPSVVFDDDTFLQKNDTKETDSIFSKGSTFFPSMPKQKNLTQKWFTGSKNKLDEMPVKGDNSYFNSRTQQSVGINNQSVEKGSQKSNKKSEKTKKRSLSQRKLNDWQFEWEHIERPRPSTALVRRLSCHRTLPSRPRTASPRSKSRQKLQQDYTLFDTPDTSDNEINGKLEQSKVATPDTPYIVTFFDQDIKADRLPLNRQDSIASKSKRGRKKKNKRSQTDEYLFFCDDPTVKIAEPEKLMEDDAPPLEGLKSNPGLQPLDSNTIPDRQPTPFPVITLAELKEPVVHADRPVSAMSTESTDIPIQIPDNEKPDMLARDNTGITLTNSRLDTGLIPTNTDDNLLDRSDTVLSRARTELALSHLKVDYMYDELSVYSELFYPDTWKEETKEAELEGYWEQNSAIWARYRKSSQNWFTDPMPPVSN